MMQQNMSQGAMAALKRAMGQYGGGLADGAGQMMQRGAAPPMNIGAAAGGLAGLGAAGAAMQGAQGPAPAAPLQAPAPPIQPSAPSVAPGSEGADPIQQRAMRIMREAQAMGDASPATLQKLTDELFSFLPEGQRQAIVAQAVAMSGGQGQSMPPSAPVMPPGM